MLENLSLRFKTNCLDTVCTSSVKKASTKFVILFKLTCFVTVYKFFESSLKLIMASKFYYFGYGSNMLAKRIHIQNPAAQRVGVGKLEVTFYGL